MWFPSTKINTQRFSGVQVFARVVPSYYKCERLSKYRCERSLYYLSNGNSEEGLCEWGKFGSCCRADSQLFRQGSFWVTSWLSEGTLWREPWGLGASEILFLGWREHSLSCHADRHSKQNTMWATKNETKCSSYQLVILIESFYSVTALWLLLRLAVRFPLTATDLKSKTSSGFAEAWSGATS